LKDKKLLPFERNRYFTGKMLTSSDFQLEQQYMNNKRRFINSMIFGSGIICGMSVYRLDDLCVFVDSGVAIDASGREIVIQEAAVKKLSAIEGFEDTTSNYIRLYVTYDEKEIQPVYAVSKKDEEDTYENNRTIENYKLFVADKEEENAFQVTSEFLSEQVLLETEDYKISITLPAIVCLRKRVKLKIMVEKLSNRAAVLYYRCLLQFPSFSSIDNKHEAEILFDNILLQKEEKLTREIWVKVNEAKKSETYVLIKASSVHCTIDSTEEAQTQDVFLKIVSDDIEPRQLVNNEIGKTSYEMKSANQTNEAICLAEIKLNRLTGSYEIEEIFEKNVKKYIEVLADQQEREDYLGYFQSDIVLAPQKDEETKKTEEASTQASSVQNMSTGIVEIPVGRKLKKGTVCYSDEVVHGLGRGNVFVTLGSQGENYYNVSREQCTIIGAPDIFKNDSVNSAFDIAVKIFNDKGSFMVGIKAKEDIDCAVVRLVWYAICFTNYMEQKEIPIVEDGRITVNTPTVVLAPKENYFFDITFNHMEPVQVGYELTESGTGQITPDGVYTAPNREGVFEIRIYCLNDTSICTYAYAIVKKKDSYQKGLE